MWLMDRFYFTFSILQVKKTIMLRLHYYYVTIITLRTESIKEKVALVDQSIEQVKNFCYLGCKISYKFDRGCVNETNKFDYLLNIKPEKLV